MRHRRRGRRLTPEEIPLEGGRDTAGVVRVGDTVRRPAKPSSAFVRALLLHLERQSCAGVPRHLGQDAAGREVLGYIPGWVPPKFRYFGDAQVAAAARLLRALHDATRGSALAAGREVVCHNDPGPNNTVFRDDLPVAIIDFDYAAPGKAIDDLGYLAWTWCVSSRPDRGPAAIQAAQLRVLADAYGLDAAGRAGLVAAMIRRLGQNIDFWTARLPTHDRAQDHVDWSAREMRFTEAHRDLFDGALQAAGFSSSAWAG